MADSDFEDDSDDDFDMFDYLDEVIHEDSSNSLTRALSDKLPSKEILALISSQLHLVREPSDGSLPLHVACSRGASLSVIERLVSVYPEGLSHQSPAHYVKLPVFLACQTKKPSLPTVEFLVEAYPACLQGTSDRVPLFHYCCSASKSEEWEQVLDFIRSKDPEVANKADYQGLYPLHHLARGQSLEVLKKFMRENPEALADRNGDNPLHHAIRSWSDKGIMNFLRKTDFILSSNQKGELPIHQCGLHFDRANILLEQDPYLLLYSTLDGRTLPGDICKELEENWKESLKAPPPQMPEDMRWEYDQEFGERHNELFDELCKMCKILQQTIIPTIRGSFEREFGQYGVPEDVSNRIMAYTIPYYEEATCSEATCAEELACLIT